MLGTVPKSNIKTKNTTMLGTVPKSKREIVENYL